MENENIRNDENLNPEEIANENIVPSEGMTDEAFEETVQETEMVETEETLEETAQETEMVETEEALEGLPAEDEDIIGEEWQMGDETVEIQLTEEEIAMILAAKKRKTAKILIVSGVVAVIAAICAFFYCYTEGVGTKTAVDTPMKINDYYLEGKEDNIKFQSPLISLVKTILGKEKDAVMTINGKAVSKDMFEYITTRVGYDNVSGLLQSGMLTSVEDFSWDIPENSTGISYLEYSKGLGINTLIPIYSLVAEGEKRGIVLSEEEEQQIRDNIEELKTQYGENFELALKMNGFKNEETVFEAQKLDALYGKTAQDIQENLSKYASADEVVRNEKEEKVTVKHILIAFDNEMTGDVTDEMKDAAKKTAEEVLAKVKNGEDFDKLIEEYNQDPGATDEGYTFAADGSMVKAFEEASFALKVGETSGLVETSYGYHIIKRLERAISTSDYAEYVLRTAKVKIKKGKYEDVGMTVDVKEYFNLPTE